MAEVSYLQQLKNAVDALSPGENITAKTRMAITWFRGIITRSMTLLKMESQPHHDLIKDAYAKKGGLTSRMWLGRMYFFVYNPKHKATLPYYDMFPLVLPVERYSDGFLGINFHYLAPKDRAFLLDEIKVFLNDKSLSENPRLI